jgi:hypothetical protein
MDNARLYGEAQREIEERAKAQDALRASAEALAREAAHAALRADVSAALAMGGTPREMLQRCADPIVNHLDAALAHIWTLDPREDVLVLLASAGLPLTADGDRAAGHLRLPLAARDQRLVARTQAAAVRRAPARGRPGRAGRAHDDEPTAGRGILNDAGVVVLELGL